MAGVFVFIAGYRDIGDALVDYGAVKNLYRRGAIDTYDARWSRKTTTVPSTSASARSPRRRRRGPARSSAPLSACSFRPRFSR